MPGIVGLVTKMPRQWAEHEMLRMLESTRHELFYETGTWVDESLGVYVGWTVCKGSFCDGLPVCNERGDVCLLFCGEDFPEPGTVRRLREQGHAVETEGPSYLVHLYEEDPSFLPTLNGRFQGLLMDRTRGTVTLFCDRYGLRRVYYHEAKDAFYFSAEAKAILDVCPELRRADDRGLGELIGCGCVLENRTVFQEINLLPAAASWIFRDGSLEQKGTYFAPREWEEQDLMEPESYYREIRDVFTRILPRYFNGRELIGMSLTGGLDTRMIMAWEKFPPASLPCYSFGGGIRDCQDVLIARKVARACEQTHQVIPVGEEFLSRFPYYAERAVYLTDGGCHVDRSADLYLNERAREIAPVRMTGNYGGEVLRRVRAFKPVEPLRGVFHDDFLTSVRKAAVTYRQLLECHPLSFAVFRQAPWHHYGLLSLEETQVSLRTPYLDNAFVRTIFRAPDSACANSNLCLRLIAEGNTRLPPIRTDRGLGGTHGSIASALSRHLLEFTFKAEYAYDYGMPQWVARVDHVLSRLHLERLFLGRHKFAHFRVWYRDVLSTYVREILLDSRALSRPYLNRKGVESAVLRHVRGDRNCTTEIHQLLTLELLHRLFLDRN